MWTRFNEPAKRVIFHAQQETQKHGAHYVSTEHLLLGLITDTDPLIAQVFEKLGVNQDRIRSEVRQHLIPGEPHKSQDITLTPRGKRILDLAYDEARHLNNYEIRPEHLLLGLIREGDWIAGRLLAKEGVELERAREEVIKAQASRVSRMFVTDELARIRTAIERVEALVRAEEDNHE